jgi:hypothetical protein
MRLGLLLVAGGAALSGALAVAACTTDYQKGLEDPNFGAPNALAGQRQPGPSTDSKTTGDGGSSSGGGADIACVKAGGAVLADGGPCAVSFKTDVLGALGSATPSCTQTTCHGGVNPANLPRIEPSDAPAMWNEFAAFKLTDGKPYINPCSADATQSGLACNVAATAGCGVHMPIGGQMPPDVVTKLETWLKCGSPNN